MGNSTKVHHIEIIGRYINLAMSSPEKPQDRSVLVILTHRVLRHFAVSNHEFQEKQAATEWTPDCLQK